MSAPTEPTGLEPVACARHPDVQTHLRCGRCGTPICPKCLVQSPVGARCPDCASPLRVVGPSRSDYLVAAAAGVGIGAAGGLLLGFGGLGGIGLLLIGFAVGEVVARAAHRRGSTALGLLAAGGAVLGPLLGRALLLAAILPGPDPSLRLAVAGEAAFHSLLSGEALFLVFAGVIAYSRAH